MPFTLTHRGTPIAGSGLPTLPISISVEAGKEVLLSLMLTGGDATVGDKYKISTSAPAGDIVFDNVELEITSIGACKAFLAFCASAGFANAGAFDIEITRTVAPAATPLVTVSATVTPAAAAPPPGPTPPPATPPAAPPATPPAPTPGTATVPVPIAITLPAPIALALTAAPPATAQAAPAKMAGWQQTLLALGALALVLIVLIVGLYLPVAWVVSHSFTAAGAGLSAEAPEPTVIYAEDVSVGKVGISTGDDDDAAAFLKTVQALGGSTTITAPASPPTPSTGGTP